MNKEESTLSFDQLKNRVLGFLCTYALVFIGVISSLKWLYSLVTVNSAQYWVIVVAEVILIVMGNQVATTYSARWSSRNYHRIQSED